MRSSALNLNDLGITPLDLSGLDAAFSEDEVWKVIKALPPDKAPSQAWPIIKADVLRNLNAFFVADRRQFHCVNGALITLIPKMSDA